MFFRKLCIAMSKLFCLFLILIPIGMISYGQNNSIKGVVNVNEFAYTSASDAQGNSYVGGMQGRDALVTKFAQNNVELWSIAFHPQADSNYRLVVTSLDVSTSFIYGCGLIQTFSGAVGSFYFKQSKFDGDLIWVQRENTSGCALTSIHEDNGQLYMTGSLSVQNSNGQTKVICANGTTGILNWQSPALDFSLPNQTGSGEDKFSSMTDVNNGKFYVVGSSASSGNTVGTNTVPILAGFDTNGNLLSQRTLFNGAANNINLQATNVKFDGDSLVIAFYGELVCTGNCSNTTLGLIKTDLQGNVGWAKSYDFINQSRELVKYLNITSTGYTLFGGGNYTSINSNLIALKTDKHGNVLFSKLINKGSLSLNVDFPTYNVGGSSDFQNGNHFFPARIHFGNPGDLDLILIRLTDSLEHFDDPCFTANDAIVQTSSLNLNSIAPNISSNPHSIFYSNDPGYSISKLTSAGCDGNDIVFPKTEFGCDSTIKNISSTIGINYDLNWLGGFTGNTATFTKDTAIEIEFVNPLKCCKFNLIHYVVLNKNPPIPTLPNDKLICGGFQGPVQLDVTDKFCWGCEYLWSTGDTTNTTEALSTGYYTIELTNNCDKSTKDSVFVEFLEYPLISDVADSNECSENFPVTFSATSSFADSIVWSNNVVGPQSTFNAPDSLYVTAYNACGVDIDTFVLRDYTPNIKQINDYDTCLFFDETVTIPFDTKHVEEIYLNGELFLDSVIVAQDPITYEMIGGNKCGADTILFNFNSDFFPHYQAPVSIDTCILPGDTMELTVDVIHGDIIWQDGSTNNSINITGSGQYSFSILSPCDTIHRAIEVNYLPIPRKGLIADIDTCIIKGQFIELEYPNFIEELTWLSSGTPSLFVGTSGVYYTKLSTVCGSILDSVGVNIKYKPLLSVPDTIKRCTDFIPFSELDVQSNLPYSVRDLNGNIVQEPLTESQYIEIQVENECGVLDAQVEVILKDETSFWIPNTFTPNEDQFNLTFEIKGNDYEIESVQIYNRWGQIVHEQIGEFTGWDGTKNGKPCAQGTYIVHVIYTICNDEIIDERYPIQILR